jgi:hypothetical protein
MTRGWQYSLEALEPAVFRRYLRARGWKESTTPGEAMHRYALDVENRQVQVEIPTVSTFADYERRIGEAMEIIAAVESRTPLDVLANLRRPQSDVVRFRIDGQETSGGTIGLDDAIRLREGRKRMLLAMAHSVVEPLPHFARLTRTDPVEFVNSCREAPARAGSYVSEVFVPVAPSMGSLGLDDPFARKVTTKLARALGRTASALNAGNDEELLHGAADGLSSNFLAALASLRPAGGVLEVGLEWAGSRPAPDLPVCTTRFAPDVFAPLEEAARVLRDQAEVPGYELEGYIAALRRDENDPTAPGEVVVAATLEDRPGTSKVYLTLDSRQYALAIEAHRTTTRIRVDGTLTRQGRRTILRHPENLRGLPDDDEATPSP